MSLPATTSSALNSTLDFDEISDNCTNYNINSDTGPLVQFANGFNIYFTPVLILLGLVGNFMSIVVFYKSKLRLQSISQYLTVLAVSDSIFLLMLLPPWLKAMEISAVFAINGFCKTTVFLSYATSNLSAWLVVAFTVERFVAVVYPLRRNAMCTVKRARYIILALTLLALIVNAPVLWFAVVEEGECNIDSELMVHAERFNIFDTMLSFTVPLVIIAVVNTWIMVCVYTLNRARRQLMRETEAQQPDVEMGPVAAVAAVGRVCHGTVTGGSQQRVTRMLLIVSSFFVLLNTPAYSVRAVAYAFNMGGTEYKGIPAALQQICLLMFHSNFAINFVLYCMSGQNFRHALLQTFAPWMRRRRFDLMMLRAVSHQPARVSSLSTSYRTASMDSPQCGIVNGGGRPSPDMAPPLPVLKRGPNKFIKKWRFDNPPRRNNYPDLPSTSRSDDTAEMYEMSYMHDRAAARHESLAGPSSSAPSSSAPVASPI